MAELDRNPWLLVLDGLERVLVEYHRIDAAQIRDDEVDTAGDPIASRDPCRTIRPEDEDLLRALTDVKRSKILASSRLMPAALISHNAGNALPGVLRVPLRGLTTDDAELLFRACGVTGDPKKIRKYLKTNCDCHPLVIGALAGLVKNNLKHRGNFDAWADDPKAGGALNLGELDLVQRRNDILDAAIAALAPESRELLGTLALLLGAADYEMLLAFNPHLPPKPEEVREPMHPEKRVLWEHWTEDRKKEELAKFEDSKSKRSKYLEALEEWQSDPETDTAPEKLEKTVLDLEKRGLLQFDGVIRKYDLHPVVRGVASGRVDQEAQSTRGQQVVDYFTSRTPSDWNTISSLEDVMLGVQIINTLTRLGKYDEAIRVYRGTIANALFFNLEAKSHSLALVKSFFPNGFEQNSPLAEDDDQCYLLNDAALLIAPIDPELKNTLVARQMYMDLNSSRTIFISVSLNNAAITETPPAQRRLYGLALEMAKVTNINDAKFRSLLGLFETASQIGEYEVGDTIWAELETLDRPKSRSTYREGEAELIFAWHRYRRGCLNEDILEKAGRKAQNSRSRQTIRRIAYLRGIRCLDQSKFMEAITNLTTAVQMAHEVGVEDPSSVAALTLARLKNGDTFDAEKEATRLADLIESTNGITGYYLAQIWQGLGENDKAIASAVKAHEWAVGSGEPYVYRFELDRIRALLTELDAELPAIPKHDPSKDKVYPWEDDVKAYIEKLKVEKAEEEAAEKAKQEADEAGGDAE